MIEGASRPLTPVIFSYYWDFGKLLDSQFGLQKRVSRRGAWGPPPPHESAGLMFGVILGWRRAVKL